MRFNGIIVVIYALLVLVGGMFGFIKANSVPSLIMGMLFGLGLLLCAVAIVNGKKPGYQAAIVLALILAAFFSYRYAMTLLLMPAGVMAILSIIVLALLLNNRFVSK